MKPDARVMNLALAYDASVLLAAELARQQAWS
jgi:hypothetical protein